MTDSGKKLIDSNNLLKELISRQINSIPQNKKLQYSDLKRICKYINSSIFDENNCCLWKGYVTNANSLNKGTYINFYFRKKKAALHRLLYINFVEELGDDEYLKFNCENKGRCCNIDHLRKFKYNKRSNIDNKTKSNKRSKKKKSIKIINRTLSNDEEVKTLFISFD
jgi:hypothetical protein